MPTYTIKVINEHTILRDACLTEMQWKNLLIWASTQPDAVYKAVWDAHEYARASV